MQLSNRKFGLLVKKRNLFVREFTWAPVDYDRLFILPIRREWNMVWRLLLRSLIEIILKCLFLSEFNYQIRVPRWCIEFENESEIKIMAQKVPKMEFQKIIRRFWICQIEFCKAIQSFNNFLWIPSNHKHSFTSFPFTVSGRVIVPICGWLVGSWWFSMVILVVVVFGQLVCHYRFERRFYVWVHRSGSSNGRSHMVMGWGSKDEKRYSYSGLFYNSRFKLWKGRIVGCQN